MVSFLWPFWNPTEHRLRAGWRVAIHLAGFLYGPALLNHFLGDPLSRLLTQAFPELAILSQRITSFSLRLVAVLLLTWLAVTWIDRRQWRSIGLYFDRAWWYDLIFGLVLGAVLMTFIFLVEYSAGWIEIREWFAVGLLDTSFVIAILGPIIVFIVVGITEELLSRGYQLTNMAEGLNFTWLGPKRAILISWALSSSLFGLLHIFNPNATWLSTLYLMLAGLFLGLGYVLTGRLGLPIGLHITWNFVQGNVYGFPVSGNVFNSATVIAVRQGGPALWTGGAFGPEAGLIGIVAILLGGLLTIVWARLHYRRVALDLSLAYYQPAHQPPGHQEPPPDAKP